MVLLRTLQLVEHCWIDCIQRDHSTNNDTDLTSMAMTIVWLLILVWYIYDWLVSGYTWFLRARYMVNI